MQQINKIAFVLIYITCTICNAQTNSAQQVEISAINVRNETTKAINITSTNFQKNYIESVYYKYKFQPFFDSLGIMPLPELVNKVLTKKADFYHCCPTFILRENPAVPLWEFKSEQKYRFHTSRYANAIVSYTVLTVNALTGKIIKEKKYESKVILHDEY